MTVAALFPLRAMPDSPVKRATSLVQVVTIASETPPDRISVCPVEVMLKIFEHLSSVDLLHLASTSSHMRWLAGSDHVWKVRLGAEMPSWPHVTASTLPGHQGMSFRVQQTYMKCSPVLREQAAAQGRRRDATDTTAAAAAAAAAAANEEHSLLPFRVAPAPSVTVGAQAHSAVFRLLTGSQAPRKMAVFGMGLDTSGRGLLGALLWSPGSPFVVEGMESGTAGVGGSITVRHTAMDTPVSMVALYDPHAADQTVAVDDYAPPALPRLTASYKAVLKKMETVVYCVDAELLAGGHGADAGAHATAAIAELRAYLALTTGTHVPVVVLAVSRPGAATVAGPVQVAQRLSLAALSRQWRVQACPVSPALSNPMQNSHACRQPLDPPLAHALAEATGWLLKTSAAAQKSPVAVGFERSARALLLNPARSVVASLLAGF